MVSDSEPGCEESRTTYCLEVERERECQIEDPDAKRAGRRTNWRWRGSVILSDCGPGCEESRTTYQLEVEREHDGVRLWTRMRREQDDVLSGGGEGA